MSKYRSRIEAVMSYRCPREKRKDGSGVPWEFLESGRMPLGEQLAFRVPTGYSAQDLRQETDALYAACGAHIELQDCAGVVLVRVIERDFPDMIPFTPAMLKETEGRTVLLGYDRTGEPVTHSFKVNPFMLIGAMSGYGKTDFVRLLILQLISRFTPAQLCIDIIDGKGFSFLPFRDIPHIRSIVRDLPGAHQIISRAKATMVKRGNEVWDAGDRNQAAKYRWEIVIIDELAMISPAMQVTDEEKKLAISTYAEMAALSCVGREAGMGLIAATQRPDAQTIHPQVKANCEASIAFKTKTLTNSEIILDRGGAEKLPPRKPGRGIYSGVEDKHFLTPYVGPDEDWDNVLTPYIREGHYAKTDRSETIDNLDGLL